MAKWRPLEKIQSKVIGIALDQGRLLAMEIYDDKGKVKGVRPLGGLIEFGETREDALKREFLEELNTAIEIASPWQVFENIYRHHGKVGHEYIFAAGIFLVDKSLYSQEVIVFSEDSGSDSTARWYTMEDLREKVVPLFPDGLIEAL